MIKKYKLIKHLPFENSPKLGYISKPVKGANDSHYWNHNWFKPENYPEFWEEVEEKEYEILSLKGNYSSCIHPIVNDEVLASDGSKMILRENTNVNHLLKKDSEAWQIHSIKRLSDGEVFTLGDKVNWGVMTYPYQIEKIFIENNLLKIYIGGGVTAILKTIQKTKNPLFTTEDGVDIFEGDDYYRIANWNIATLTMGIRHNNAYAGAKFFSTREKAEEYILWNKPVLSLNDLNNLNLVFSGNIEYFKEYIKEKL